MKRTVEIFTVILTLFLLFAPYLQPVAAQASGWRDSSFGNEYDAADSGEVNAGGYTDRTVKGEMASLSCMIMPVFGVCTADKNKMGSLMKNSAVAYLGNYITLMYSNPPADLALWIRDTGRALGFFPKQVYAQGVGFSGLAPLLPLWKAFRNIAYLLLAIVMIIVGFMVMFRKKIDPKTVVTVQNALPRIVVTLLLITFSYAIVGLLIDIMYLIILLAVGVVKTTGLLPDPSGIPSLFGFKTQEQVFATGGLSTFIYDVFPWGPASLLQVVSQMLGLAGVGIPGIIFGLTGAIVGFFTGGPVGVAIGALTGFAAVPLVLTLLISLALLFIFVRIFLLVLSAYIQIVLALLVGPVQLLLEAVPGGMGFSSWIKNLIANLAVFPTIAIMGLIAIAFATSAAKSTGVAFWSPPYGLIGGNVQSISALFSLGILMAIPQVANSIKAALKAKPAVPAGPGAIFAPLTGAFQTTTGVISQFYYGASMAETIQRLRGKTPGKT